MTTPALAEVPVRSALALTRRWIDLLQPSTFGARALWLAWFDADGRQSPVLVPVDNLPVTPDPHRSGRDRPSLWITFRAVRRVLTRFGA